MDLNEKLARWAGFENLVYEQGVWEMRWFWVDEGGRRKELPRFTESLDACFKWLVPKVRELEYRVSVGTEPSDRGELYDAHIFYGYYEDSWFDEDYCKSSALALCKAIEQLIDKENTNE